jgi:acyl carrier protein
MANIQDNLLSFIKEQFMIDMIDENIGLDESLILSGVIDSTGLIELCAFIEEDYKIKINEGELNQDNFGSVNEIVNFIHTKLS